MPRPRLADNAIDKALLALPQWTRRGESLAREFAFPTFRAAMSFVNQVADSAEAACHHPDIHIHYTTVQLVYWTHDAGGITRADVKAAASIDVLYDAVNA